MNDVSLGRLAARVLVGVIWIATAVAAVAVFAELLFEYRAASARSVRVVPSPSPRLDALRVAYEPFNEQHLHPQYLFFFPLDRQARIAIGNATASIDADGYREPGPAQARGRTLAVMLGGSAAFGEFATSNAKTITSYLNRLQDQYFFVNAGVSAFTSTQELLRLVLEVVDLHPGLVVAYDGANDGASAGMSDRRFVKYPPGTPEFFSTLENLVEDFGSVSRRTLLTHLFPELRLRLAAFRAGGRDAPEPSAADVAAVASLYLSNRTRMAEITQAMGARFVSVFQPVAALHRHVDPSWAEGAELMVPFHDAVAKAAPPDFEAHDFSSVFDDAFASVPITRTDIADDTIFVDSVHLTDRGNELVARHLIDALRLRQGIQ